MKFKHKYNGNILLIEKTKSHPYKGASKTTCFRVKVYDSYGFLFHVAVYDDIRDAISKTLKIMPYWEEYLKY